MPLTTMTIFRVGLEPTDVKTWLEDQPTYRELKDLLVPRYIAGPLEHVSVLHEGERRDLFVDEEFIAKGLPFNEAASAIYRANWMSQHPDADPDKLPPICGTAVLFCRRVWF